jgi:hypothetical protein
VQQLESLHLPRRRSPHEEGGRRVLNKNITIQTKCNKKQKGRLSSTGASVHTEQIRAISLSMPGLRGQGERGINLTTCMIVNLTTCMNVNFTTSMNINLTKCMVTRLAACKTPHLLPPHAHASSQLRIGGARQRLHIHLVVIDAV